MKGRMGREKEEEVGKAVRALLARKAQLTWSKDMENEEKRGFCRRKE